MSMGVGWVFKDKQSQVSLAGHLAIVTEVCLVERTGSVAIIKYVQ